MDKSQDPVEERDRESPEMDLRSSSPLLVGEIGSMTRDISDMERSRGESMWGKIKETNINKSSNLLLPPPN